MRYESATNASVSPAGRQNPGTSTVTDRIQKTAKAHVVILFGSYARGDYKLERGLEHGKKSDYDLLVITADSDSRRAISLELPRAFDDTATSVQLVVETIATVNANLSERQFFPFPISAGRELCCTIRENMFCQNRQRSSRNKERKWLRKILRCG